jgi:hypothetical protein
VTAGDDRRGRGSDLPRRLGEILTPALNRIAGGDEARAYVAWARAVGEPVTRGTRPKAFRRGQLTVECASSVWANELTYLGPQILRRMDEVAPGHPVERFRFVVGRLPVAKPLAVGTGAAAQAPHTGAPGAGRDAATGSPADPARGGREQGSDPSAAKENRRHQPPPPDAEDAAGDQAEGVQDERLRAAIEAALRRSSEEPPEAPGRGTPSG